MKNMTPKKANLILKIVVISSFVALGWAAIGVSILTVQLQLNDIEMQILLACSLGVWVFLSILYLVLLYKFRNIIKDPEPKPGEPVAIRPSDTYSIFCSTRQELDEYLEMLLPSKYDSYKLTNFSRPGQMFAYEQKRKPWNIFTSFHYYFVAYLEEFQEEDDGAIYSCANRFLRSHPTGFVFIKQIRINYLIVVDRDSEPLRRYLNRRVDQLYQYYRLPAAICLEDQTLRIGREKDGYGIAQYHRLRKSLLKLFGLKKKDRKDGKSPQ